MVLQLKGGSTGSEERLCSGSEIARPSSDGRMDNLIEILVDAFVKEAAPWRSR